MSSRLRPRKSKQVHDLTLGSSDGRSKMPERSLTPTALPSYYLIDSGPQTGIVIAIILVAPTYVYVILVTLTYSSLKDFSSFS